MIGGNSLGQVLAVVSGKGGTGKTSLCAGIACALASDGRKVLCIDADVGLRNLDISLGMAQEPAIPPLTWEAAARPHDHHSANNPPLR